jgi:nucleotide-binding universal stress UspA family protein
VIDVKSVLCPTDFSDSSRRALEHAIPIAGWYGAPLTALHVVPPWPAEVLLAAGFAALPPPALDEARIREELLAFLEPARAAGLDTRAEVAQGSIVGETLRLAEEMDAPLLALGTHGRSAFERLVLGSVTEKVMRKAVAPVLTVGPAGGPAVAAPPLFRHILCAVDFSHGSLSPLEFAFALAQEAQGKITLLHVDEPGARAGEARAWLENAIPPGARDWCAPEIRVAEGRAWREIVKAAAEEHCDLVVMGAHGREALDRAFFGSTTSHVVRQAHCAVLTVREL